MYTSFLFLNFFNLKNFYLFFFYYDYYYFLAVPCSMQDLISLTRDGTHPPMLEVQSLNQWTSREVPVVNLLKASHFHLMASVRVTLNQQLIFLVGKPFMAVLAKQAHSSAHREVLFFSPNPEIQATPALTLFLNTPSTDSFCQLCIIRLLPVPRNP